MRRRILVILMSCMLVLSFAACGSGSDGNDNGSIEAEEMSVETEDDSGTSIAVGEYQGYFFLYDASWRVLTDEEGEFLYLYPTDNNSDGFVMLHYESASIGTKEANLAIFAENMTSSDSITEVSYNYETDILDTYARNIQCTQLIDNTECFLNCYAIADGDCGVLSITQCTPENSNVDFSDGFFEILSTIDRFLDGYRDYPDESINDIDEEVENGVDYFSVYLDYSEEWDVLDYADQFSLAEICIEYCLQRAAEHYGMTRSDINVFAFTDDGKNAFSYDGGNEVRIYIDGKYDSSHHLT